MTPDVFTTFFVMTFGFDIDSTPAQSALRALDLGAKFQIVAIRILRETEGLKEIRGTTKGTFSKHKEGLRTLAESLVQMTCSDFTNFLVLAEFAI